MAVDVKICGLSTAGSVAAALDSGADYVGFVFFRASPRYIEPARAAALAADVLPPVRRVGLVVDPSDEEVEALLDRVPLDMIQLHGGESPARVGALRRRFGLPVIKAVAIAGASDLRTARAFETAADQLLFDARPPPGASRPGGNAVSFDWGLVKSFACRIPWLLAGGLDETNVADAVRLSGAGAVDVSSGVETAPGVKSCDKIRRFLRVAKAIETEGVAHERR